MSMEGLPGKHSTSVLKAADISTDDLTAVFLSGGITRIPFVRKIAEEYFSGPVRLNALSGPTFSEGYTHDAGESVVAAAAGAATGGDNNSRRRCRAQNKATTAATGSTCRGAATTATVATTAATAFAAAVTTTTTTIAIAGTV